MSSILQFEPLQSAVEPAFWAALAAGKIDVYKLDDAAVPVAARFACGDAFLPTTGAPLPAQIVVGADALANPINPSTRSATVMGSLKNTNTIEGFKAIDKNKLLKDSAMSIWHHIRSGAAVKNPSHLCHFLLITFADLKKFKFYYWFAFPALMPTDALRLAAPAQPIANVMGAHMLDAIQAEFERFQTTTSASPFFLIKSSKTTCEISPLADFEAVFPDKTKVTVGFIDPSALSEHPGWPLRNFLALLSSQWGLERVSIVCYRESARRPRDISASIVLDVLLAAYPDDPKVVGWEKNVQGKLAPRMANLAPLMDPKRLAETAVDLNLKLMRWRILPELKLENVSQAKCLLFGAGTLGCYISRILLAWGVRTITFVDNGKVSYSNPVRQPLFNYADCLGTGKPKAETAAAALQGIFPGVNATGHDISVPMPGHSIQSDTLKKDVERIEDLVRDHDVLFLLTDSRESRWLPSLLGASMGKIVINAALGFDTFVVMRHGMRVPLPESRSKVSQVTTDQITDLGCYFCNDVVAPTDSLSDRTLDQQCTVTRPGLAAIASALAVELFSSTVNHPLGPWVPATTETSGPSASILGALPHQIRGFLNQFNNLLVVGHAYDKCPACSHRVLDAYATTGYEFIVKALESPKFLEDVSGLSELKIQDDEVDVEWDDEFEQE